MANKGPSYGLSLECQRKIEKKFDIERARDVVTWMEAVLNRQLHPDVKSLSSEQELAKILKDGTALCELMIAINPGCIKRFKKATTAFKQMENIELFTKACVEYGVLPLDVFQVTDLYERKAMFTVLNCLHALGSLAQKKGFQGPSYGVKLADKNVRTFSDEQVMEGKRVIPMQAGSNLHPSQSGMTPYGQGRQIVYGNDVNTLHQDSASVISLQYGTNRLASQSGMTPYGLGRQILLSSGSGSTSYAEQRDSTAESRGSNGSERENKSETESAEGESLSHQGWQSESKDVNKPSVSGDDDVFNGLLS